MHFTHEDIRYSQQIFYALLEKRKLHQEQDKELFHAYHGNELVATLVKEQAEIANCQVERYGSTIYLIPKENNELLGFSKRDLRLRLCRSQATDRDYYLSQFVILTILVEFHDGSGLSSVSREFLRVGDLQNLLTKRLQDGANRLSKEAQQQNGVAYTNMLEAFEALKSDDRGSRKKTTKEGFLYHILIFLQEQELIDYIEVDERIMPTHKLQQFMDYNLLNRNHYDRIKHILEVVENESNESNSDYQSGL